ncbi:MAG: hypothetical protein ACD_64C00319G0001 [uncultured bacterium]|nr:MAG: hypothetical protein ACD_64C00319G0001 [uncultured bacterium]
MSATLFLALLIAPNHPSKWPLNPAGAHFLLLITLPSGSTERPWPLDAWPSM